MNKAFHSDIPRGLRGEEHKVALSGPVVTYGAVEELYPNQRGGPGITVSISEGKDKCFYISRLGAEWLIERGRKVRVKIDNLNRRIIIIPDPNGPWRATRVGGHKKGKPGYTASIGASALRRQLIARGFQPGRYPARIEGDKLIVECGKK